MKAYDVFKEYIWLVQTIYKHRRISLEEINSLWRNTDMSGGLDFNRTTFSRHKDAIQDIFGLYIECDRKNGYKYYIGNSYVLEGDSIQNWLLSTLSVDNIISESLSVQNRIQIEAIPEDRFLVTMIEAMKKNCKVEIEYQRFGTSLTKTHIFSPYAIKVYQRRWYVLAYFDAQTPMGGKYMPAHFAIFAFDRMEKVTVLNEKFNIPETFNASDFFSDCYGIVYGDGIKAEKVVIRAFGNEVFNLRTLPLHHSQKEILQTDDFADFELYLKPTLDFSGKILSRGEWLEVIKPEWLRDEIANMHKKALKRYEK